MDIAVSEVPTPLWELACLMGSHSVTCHPKRRHSRLYSSLVGVEFKAPLDTIFTPAKLVLDLVLPE